MRALLLYLLLVPVVFGVSPEDARTLRSLFRVPSTQYTFQDPELARWFQSLRGLASENIVPLLGNTYKLVQNGSFTLEQGHNVLAWVDSKYPLLDLTLPAGPAKDWAWVWKHEQGRQRVWYGSPLSPTEQDAVLRDASTQEKDELIRELYRGQETLSPAAKLAWDYIAAAPSKHNLLVEEFGPVYREWERFLGGHGLPPTSFPPEAVAGVQASLAYERSLQAVVIPQDGSALQTYVLAWQQYQATQAALGLVAAKKTTPVSLILQRFNQRNLRVHWNHLVIAYLQRTGQKAGPKPIADLIQDAGVPPAEFATYLLNEQNLWILQGHLAPFGEWLLSQTFLPVESLPGLEAVANDLAQQHGYLQMVELGRKARQLYVSPYLDEWGHLLSLRGQIGAGAYAEARVLAQQIQQNGGFKEYPQLKLLKALVSAYYLAGDPHGAYSAAWELHALAPAASDRAFLADLASQQGWGYEAQFLRRY